MNGSSFVGMLVLTVTSFCIISIVVLRMITGLLLSFWGRFFVLGMMIVNVEYRLVMAEVCRRQH